MAMSMLSGNTGVFDGRMGDVETRQQGRPSPERVNAKGFRPVDLPPAAASALSYTVNPLQGGMLDNSVAGCCGLQGKAVEPWRHVMSPCSAHIEHFRVGWLMSGPGSGALSGVNTTPAACMGRRQQWEHQWKAAHHGSLHGLVQGGWSWCVLDQTALPAWLWPHGALQFSWRPAHCASGTGPGCRCCRGHMEGKIKLGDGRLLWKDFRA